METMTSQKQRSFTVVILPCSISSKATFDLARI